MILTLALLLAATADPPRDFYQRIIERARTDPAFARALAGHAPEMHEIDWLAGTWDFTLTVEGRPALNQTGTSVATLMPGGAWMEIRDTYGTGMQDVGYLGYNVSQGGWTSVALDSLANANTAFARRWDHGRLVFESDVAMLGLSAHLRQTIERQGDNDYIATSEELVGGSWRRILSYHYHRRGTP